MAKDMKTRKGRDNIYYPYTSPDLVIDSTGENQTVKNNNMKSEIQTIKENQIILVDDDTSIEGISDTVYDTLTTTDKTLIGAINELNSKEHIERANKTVTGNALTIGKEHYQQFTVNADTVATLPTDLAYRRIVLYVNCTTKDSILTLKYTKDANTDEIKFKLKQDSLNIFTLDYNETSFVVTKESSEDAVLTSTEEQNGIQI